MALISIPYKLLSLSLVLFFFFPDDDNGLLWNDIPFLYCTYVHTSSSFFFNIINIYTHKLRWWFFISTLACIIVCCRYYKRENYYCSVYIITILCAQCAWVPFDLLLLSFNSHFYDYVCSLSSPIGHVIIKSKNKKKQKTSQQKVLSLNINFFLFLFFILWCHQSPASNPVVVVVV
jgi:hypothetical protein